jgi:peptidoglycan hydrolase-like protein with peptidoglycan-binding domain/3D (Asp-Asp-Asp) domain-containing protein
MKLFTAFLSVISILLSFFLIPVSYASQDTYFIVTAYYSPLPNQSHYAMGNYEAEKRMNGKGTNGASWAQVFSGMLAAPNKYGFGTKIYIEWLGIGDVQDRWGAIVRAGKRGYEHDRIDVWVGSGEEGLARAMYWGKRKVKWQVVSAWKPSSLDYNSIPAPSWALNNVKRAQWWVLASDQDQTTQKLWLEESVFDTPANTKKKVTQLQEILQELEYYDGEIDGDYSSLIETIVSIQINHELIASEDHPAAGWFGPQTRSTIQWLYNEHKAYQAILEQQEAQDKQAFVSAELAAQSIIDSIGQPVRWTVSPWVRELQLQLAHLWYFEHKDTAIFGWMTSTAILDYQIDTGILDWAQDRWAGIYGPQTREALQKSLRDDLYYQNLLKLDWYNEWEWEKTM